MNQLVTEAYDNDVVGASMSQEWFAKFIKDFEISGRLLKEDETKIKQICQLI